MKKLSFAFAAIASGLLASDPVPASRRIDWTPNVLGGIGAVGGIKTRTHILNALDYGADPTGATDVSAAYAAMLNASSEEDVLYFPAGTYRLDGQLGESLTGLGYIRQNRTIRGAGAGVTFFDCRGSSGASAISIGSASQFNYPSDCLVTGGLTRGSTTVTVAGSTGTSAFSVGQIIKINFDNPSVADIASGAPPVVSVYNFDRMRSQTVRITELTSSTISFSPGIYHTPSAGTSAKITQSIYYTKGWGLEDFTLLSENRPVAATFVVTLFDTLDCWMKNVESSHCSNYHVYIASSANFEMTGCHLHDGPGASHSNGAGLLMGSTCASFVYNNFFENVAPLTEINFGSSGNAIAYNGGDKSGFNTNHGPHNAFNLYEGNVVPWFQPDGYFGSVSEEIYLRNWVTGRYYDGSQTFMFSLNRFGRNQSLVGNIIGNPGTTGSSGISTGNPNMGSSSYIGASTWTGSDYPWHWDRAAGHPKTWTGTLASKDAPVPPVTRSVGGTITVDSATAADLLAHKNTYTATSEIAVTGHNISTIVSVVGTTVTIANGNGDWYYSPSVPVNVGDTVTFTPGHAAFQPIDLAVLSTAIVKQNYNNWSGGGNAIPPDQGLGADEVVVTSYIYASKPAFFGTKQWPMVDASAPVTTYNDTNLSMLPAWDRKLHNSNAAGLPDSGGGGGSSAPHYSPKKARVLRR